MGGVRDLPKEKNISTTDANLSSLFYFFWCDVEVFRGMQQFFFVLNVHDPFLVHKM